MPEASDSLAGLLNDVNPNAVTLSPMKQSAKFQKALAEDETSKSLRVGVIAFLRESRLG